MNSKESTGSEECKNSFFIRTRKGILLVDYLEKEKIMNSEYHVNLLEQFHQTIREKRPELEKNENLFQQDMAQIDYCDDLD